MDLLHSLKRSVAEFKTGFGKIKAGELADYAHLLHQSLGIRQTLCTLDAILLDHYRQSQVKCSQNGRVELDRGDVQPTLLIHRFASSDIISLPNRLLDSTQREISQEFYQHCSEETNLETSFIVENIKLSPTRAKMFKFFDEPPSTGRTKQEDFYSIDELPADAMLFYENPLDVDENVLEQRFLTTELADLPMRFVTQFSEMLLQPPIEKAEEFEAYMIYAISPMEFYVLKKQDFWIRSTIECLLMDGEEEFMGERRNIPFPGPGEDFAPDMPCLAWVNDRLNRAIIRFSGFQDVQVFLIDYGTSHLVAPDDLFYMPFGIATIVPGLAVFCTLEDADSRMLDTAAWKTFLDSFSEDFEIIIRGFGTKRRTHGYLVQIIDSHTGTPLSFGVHSTSWKEMRKVRAEKQRALSVSPRVISTTASCRSASLDMDLDELDTIVSSTNEISDRSKDGTSIHETISKLYKWKR
ncbi:unnamed protein product, partial [Mesorhabditis belari]|uniref:Tudor domain-containing protein n=1 Tax=Mesorhabditis belari TaxID=2138241 RepID=A0AAF3FDY1_9BILA